VASTHKSLRSGTANKRPTTAIADGQIALNTNTTSPGLFFKDSTGATIIKVGPVHVGTTAPNASPAAGGSSGNSTGEVWLDTSLTPNGIKIWNGSAWVNATPAGSTTVQGLLELATNAETQTGSDTARAVTPASLQSKVSDSTSTTSSTTIASSTAVKSAYDLANAALPKSGGTVTGNLEIGTTGSLTFEGSTADGFETTLAVTDPTADRTITFPDQTGTVLLGSATAYIDSSSRLLLGTSTSISSWSVAAVEIVGDTTNNGALILGRNDTSITDGNGIGAISFRGNDANGTYEECAKIEAQADGTHGDGDKPTRLVFSTTPTGSGTPSERVRIDNAGDTYIGTTVSPTSSISGFLFTQTGRQIQYSPTATSAIRVFEAGGNAGYARIMGDGDLENSNNRYTGISDAKLKQNIEDASSQWDDIKNIRVRKYELIANPTRKQIGVIAQELEQVSPGLVIERVYDEDTGETVKSVAYSVLYMKAVKALQEAMERIETLEAKVAALEGGAN
jgi:hypothetical protein